MEVPFKVYLRRSLNIFFVVISRSTGMAFLSLKVNNIVRVNAPSASCGSFVCFVCSSAFVVRIPSNWLSGIHKDNVNLQKAKFHPCVWELVHSFKHYTALLLSNGCISCYSVDVFRWSAATNWAVIMLLNYLIPQLYNSSHYLSCFNGVKYSNFPRGSFCCLIVINMLFTDVVM